MCESTNNCKHCQNALNVLYNETGDLLYNTDIIIPTIKCEELLRKNWPLIFFREYVSKNMPLLIKRGAKNLVPVKKWNSAYFLEKIPNKDVTVAVTPNGYADGINVINGVETFVLPEEKPMKMKEFLEILDEQKENYVCYIQKQNSNLTVDFSELLSDIGSDVKWASESFGSKPDAVNFWMGDKRAITSMHKDHYENIYIVIDGYKDFILIPPCDLPYVPSKKYPILRYKNVNPNKFEVENDSEAGTHIDWISVDPLDKKSIENNPEFTKSRIFNVRVEKGDILYLPSLWFHHVRQSHKCIAVNYWYDMDFQDLKYCYYKTIASLCEKEGCT